MPNPLTQAFVDKIKPTDRRRLIADGACKGLYLDVRPNGRSFRFRFTDKKGVHRSVTIGDAQALKLSEARDRALELRRERALGIGIGEEPKINACPTFRDFVTTIYMPHALTVRRAAKQDWGLFKNHLFPVFGELRLNEITRVHIAAFMQEKRNNGYMSSTCNRLLARLKAVMSYATELEVEGFEKNPARGYKQYKEPAHKDRFLSPAEADNLLTSVRKSESPFLECIIPFLLLTGSRKGEALTARWEHIDWQARRWYIPLTKTGKPRHVPLSEGAVKVLLWTRAKHEALALVSAWIFPNPQTMKPYSSIYYAWHHARKRVGLEDVRIHDLRHSFASALVNRGMTLYDIKEVLGHSNIATTQRYAHLSQERLREAVSQADAHYPVFLPQLNILPLEGE
jgi:integrase